MTDTAAHTTYTASTLPLTWDTPAWRQLRDAKLRDWLLGDELAVDCALMISNALEVWDDLIDRDQALDAATINKAFWDLLITLPNNPFYARHRARLEPLLIATINGWLDAEALVKRPEEHWRWLAFYLRNTGNEMIPACAFIVGGFANMRRVSLAMREFLAHETFADWNKEHPHDHGR